MKIAPMQGPATVEEVMERIASIDLTMVKQKLADAEEGQGWDEEYTNHVETRYRRFLCMLFMHPDGSVVPTKEIDLFWHQHILDTRAYADDCARVFGYFVHHFPYFGMRDEQDARDLLASFENTKRIYLNLFGEEYCVEFGGQAKNSSKCHKCKSGCGGVQCHKCR